MPHSLPKPAFFSILVILALHQVKVHGKNISIIRGEKDVFTNLAECRLAKAVCFDTDCTNCQCKGLNETYVQRRGKYGECVRNEYFAYATGKWLVYVSALGLCRGFLYFLDLSTSMQFHTRLSSLSIFCPMHRFHVIIFQWLLCSMPSRGSVTFKRLVHEIH